MAPVAFVLADDEELLTVGEVEVSDEWLKPVFAGVGRFRDALEAGAVVLLVGEAAGCWQEAGTVAAKFLAPQQGSLALGQVCAVAH